MLLFIYFLCIHSLFLHTHSLSSLQYHRAKIEKKGNYKKKKKKNLNPAGHLQLQPSRFHRQNQITVRKPKPDSADRWFRRSKSIGSDMSTGELLSIEPVELKFPCELFCLNLSPSPPPFSRVFLLCHCRFNFVPFFFFSWAEEADLMFSSIV